RGPTRREDLLVQPVSRMRRGEQHVFLTDLGMDLLGSVRKTAQCFAFEMIRLETAFAPRPANRDPVWMGKNLTHNPGHNGIPWMENREYRGIIESSEAGEQGSGHDDACKQRYGILNSKQADSARLGLFGFFEDYC